MQKICLTNGNITLHAKINDTVAAKDFLARLPCNISGCDSGMDYCCPVARGRYDPTETQIGWKNGDLCLCDGWFAILYGGEEVSEQYGSIMIIGHLEEQSIMDVQSLPSRVTLYVEQVQKVENIMEIIEAKTFDEERALYGSTALSVRDCTFDGPADGESAFKECEDITVERCFFNLRYPFWHVHKLKISDSEMTEFCRAALWYSNNIKISGTKLHGIKALRECSIVSIHDCNIISPEFGQSTRGIRIENTTASSEYFLTRSENITFKNVTLNGKYSFQYIKNARFENCIFDTKDAFWHCENVFVKNSMVKGEYLAWYSNSLTLENCKIIGTQPFCYCKNLKLVNCEMTDCDLAFEKSEVEAQITTPVMSIKNPLSGTISVPSVGEIICNNPNCHGEIHLT